MSWIPSEANSREEEEYEVSVLLKLDDIAYTTLELSILLRVELTPITITLFPDYTKVMNKKQF